MPFGHGRSAGGLESTWFGLGGAYSAEEGACGGARPHGSIGIEHTENWDDGSSTEGGDKMMS